MAIRIPPILVYTCPLAMWFYHSSQQVGKSIEVKYELALWWALDNWMRQSGAVWLPSIGLKSPCRKARDKVQASLLENVESVATEEQPAPTTMHTSETTLKWVTSAQLAMDWPWARPANCPAQPSPNCQPTESEANTHKILIILSH